MSIFTAVSVEINKNVLDSIGDQPLSFFENIVQQSGVEVHVADDGQFVKVTGEWAAVNLAYDLIYRAIKNDNTSHNNVRSDTDGGIKEKSSPVMTRAAATNTDGKGRGRSLLKHNVPTPLIVYSGLSTSDIKKAEESGVLAPGSLSRNVCDIDKGTLRDKFGDVISSMFGTSDKIAVDTSSGSDVQIYINEYERNVDTSANTLKGKINEKGDISNNAEIGQDEDGTKNQEVTDSYTSDNLLPRLDTEYVHKKLSTRKRDVDSKAIKDEENGIVVRSQRTRRPPNKYGMSEDEAESSGEISESNSKKRGRTRRKLTDSTKTLADDQETVMRKRKRGRPRKLHLTTDLKCSKCCFVGKYSSHLNDHIRRRHIEESNSFPCEYCDKVFGFNKDLTRHMLRHTDPRFSCAVCGKEYKDEKTAALHCLRHKSDYEPPPRHPCPHCTKTFCNGYILKNHVKSEHLGIKKLYVCPKCGKSFTQKHAYIQHANVHLGIKPYTCDKCQSAFTYEKSLKEHKLLHAKECNFLCCICEKSFRQKSALIIHQKIHKSTRDFLCSTCSRGFTQKQALLRHERIHSGAKPYTCKHCGRAFSDTSVVRRHMILVHKMDASKWREATISEKPKRNQYFVEKSRHDHMYAGIDSDTLSRDSGDVSKLGGDGEDKSEKCGESTAIERNSITGDVATGEGEAQMVDTVVDSLTVLADQAGRSKFDDLVHAAVESVNASGDMIEMSRVLDLVSHNAVARADDGRHTTQSFVINRNPAIIERLQTPSAQYTNPGQSTNYIYIPKPPTSINSEISYTDESHAHNGGEVFVEPVQTETAHEGHVIQYPVATLSPSHYVTLQTPGAGIMALQINDVSAYSDIPRSTQGDSSYPYLYNNSSFTTDLPNAIQQNLYYE